MIGFVSSSDWMTKRGASFLSQQGSVADAIPITFRHLNLENQTRSKTSETKTTAIL